MGFKERTILYKYALKNGMIPMLTIIGTSFSLMFFEVSLIEVAIGRPGLGSLMVMSVMQRQYNTAMAVMLVVTLITLICNYIVDLLCFAIDPRVRYQYKRG